MCAPLVARTLVACQAPTHWEDRNAAIRSAAHLG